MTRQASNCNNGGCDPAALVRGIDWLGHSAFRIRASKTIYIDPWRIGPGPHTPADLILITHPHSDHCSPSDLANLPGVESAEIVTVADGARKLSRRSRVIEPGETIRVCGVNVTAVPAYNRTKPQHPRGSGWVGYLIQVDGRKIYHAGDTDRIPEMKDVRCHVALLPVGGKYTMTPDEAARAAEDTGARLVVPMHHGSMPGMDLDMGQLFRASSVPTVLLPSGRGDR